MSEEKQQRGRPVVYAGELEQYVVDLLKKTNNATIVRRILNAVKGRKYYDQRDLQIVPKPLGISPPTIGKIAKKHGIVLPKGRPVVKKAA
jgi:hypothetical protein